MIIEEHDLYMLRAIVEGLEEEQSIDPEIAVKFTALLDAEIERQSITDVDVQKAIEYLKPIARHSITANRKHLETAITALEQMKRGAT